MSMIPPADVGNTVVLKRVPMRDVPKGARIWWHAYTTSSNWGIGGMPADKHVFVEVPGDADKGEG